MDSLLLAAVAFAGYLLAYRIYGRYLARRVFRIEEGARTAAHELRDDRDYLPTKRSIVFGHHFTSIAGTGPIVGPAIGIIWGWLPAFLWVFLGPVFIGAVHDFSAIVISSRHGGRSIGETAGHIITPRARLLFLILILFLLLVVITIFAMVIAVLFQMYPHSVFPIWMQVPIAVGLGHVLRKTSVPALPASIVGVALLYATIAAGVYLPLEMPPLFGIPPFTVWVVLLLAYAYVASVLPVWQLLQPRDYINGHQLFVALAVLVLWPLFGATNQLLGGLALLVATVYLIRRGANSLVTGVPMVFMLAMTLWAMAENLLTFWSAGNWLLLTINLAVVGLDVWMITEAVIVMSKLRGRSSEMSAAAQVR